MVKAVSAAQWRLRIAVDRLRYIVESAWCGNRKG